MRWLRALRGGLRRWLFPDVTSEAARERNLASIALGKLLAASDAHRDRAMAGWQGVKALEELFGTNEDGTPFGGPMLDGMAGGGGAMSNRDGIDTGGHTSSLRATIANVESYELRYPILYLYRRQTPDSGGPGRYRGGTARPGPSARFPRRPVACRSCP